MKRRLRERALRALVEAWSVEMGAISYAKSITLMDLLLLAGAVDNRRVNEEFSLRITELEKRADKLSQIESTRT